VPRLRRSDCSGPGLRRVRRGRGFSYVEEDGRAVTDREALDRIAALAIPPAWRDVWICTDPRGHLQATGVDAAGRKQYRYHDQWRRRRDRAKFETMLDFARALPRLRRRVGRDLAGEPLGRDQVLGCAVRLLDIGFFRVGNEEYEGRGLTTLLRSHVTIRDELLVFDYPAKGGARRVQTITDPEIHDVVARLRRRRSGPEQLLGFREGRRWRSVDSEHINAYLKQWLGGEFSAKDFRTWNATVLAALALAMEGFADTRSGRRRRVNSAVKGVAYYLGNTPAVCRASYIDPRVFDAYLSGHTIAGTLRRLAGEPDLTDWPARRRIEKATIGLLAAEG
jgi:DNA topoisomerase I